LLYFIIYFICTLSYQYTQTVNEPNDKQKVIPNKNNKRIECTIESVNNTSQLSAAVSSPNSTSNSFLPASTATPFSLQDNHKQHELLFTRSIGVGGDCPQHSIISQPDGNYIHSIPSTQEGSYMQEPTNGSLKNHDSIYTETNVSTEEILLPKNQYWWGTEGIVDKSHSCASRPTEIPLYSTDWSTIDQDKEMHATKSGELVEPFISQELPVERRKQPPNQPFSANPIYARYFSTPSHYLSDVNRFNTRLPLMTPQNNHNNIHNHDTNSISRPPFMHKSFFPSNIVPSDNDDRFLMAHWIPPKPSKAVPSPLYQNNCFSSQMPFADKMFHANTFHASSRPSQTGGENVPATLPPTTFFQAYDPLPSPQKHQQYIKPVTFKSYGSSNEIIRTQSLKNYGFAPQDDTLSSSKCGNMNNMGVDYYTMSELAPHHHTMTPMRRDHTSNLLYMASQHDALLNDLIHRKPSSLQYRRTHPLPPLLLPTRGSTQETPLLEPMPSPTSGILHQTNTFINMTFNRTPPSHGY
jgi:hypothetical protein